MTWHCHMSFCQKLPSSKLFPLKVLTLFRSAKPVSKIKADGLMTTTILGGQLQVKLWQPVGPIELSFQLCLGQSLCWLHSAKNSLRPFFLVLKCERFWSSLILCGWPCGACKLLRWLQIPMLFIGLGESMPWLHKYQASQTQKSIWCGRSRSISSPSIMNTYSWPPLLFAFLCKRLWQTFGFWPYYTWIRQFGSFSWVLLDMHTFSEPVGHTISIQSQVSFVSKSLQKQFSEMNELIDPQTQNIDARLKTQSSLSPISLSTVESVYLWLVEFHATFGQRLERSCCGELSWGPWDHSGSLADEFRSTDLWKWNLYYIGIYRLFFWNTSKSFGEAFMCRVCLCDVSLQCLHCWFKSFNGTNENLWTIQDRGLSNLRGVPRYLKHLEEENMRLGGMFLVGSEHLG